MVKRLIVAILFFPTAAISWIQLFLEPLIWVIRGSGWEDDDILISKLFKLINKQF